MFRDKHGLTPRQRLFCEHYLKSKNGKNGAQAARAAGYSAKCAKEIACDLLTFPHVKKYLEVKMKESIEKIGVTRDWRLQMLKKGVEISYTQTKLENGEKIYRNLDLAAVRKLINEINKMAGDHAPVTSNVNVSEIDLSETCSIAENAEKEIKEIKSF